ncbi:MAG TPA: T9SS type A sorting domain-containing protein, partial [Salinivirgaceae bacterium]|nr:T9SS type A sorting domain-containing protein [Salinivirgaceae bacterium]
NLPAGWTFTDSTGNQFYWQWSQQGPRGRYTSPNGGLVPRNQLTPAAAIASTTAANGFLLMPSDWYNTRPEGNAVAPAVTMNSTIEYGPVDLSSYPVVHFRMEYFFRLLKPAGASVSVRFRNLNNVVDYRVEIPYQENLPSDNAQLFDIDLTNTPVAGKAGIYVSVNQKGSSHYFFMLDDMAFYQPQNNDLRVENQWFDYRLSGPLNLSSNLNFNYFGGYRNIPIGLLEPFIQTRTAVLNFGGVARNNVRAQVSIQNLDIPDLNTIQTTESQPRYFAIGQRDTLVTTLNFRPTHPGQYQFTTIVTDGQTESTNLNRTQNIVTITEGLYSFLDPSSTNGLSYVFADSSSLNHGFGQLYWVPNLHGSSFRVTHMAFQIHSSQSANALNADTIEVTGKLFKKQGNNFVLVQQTNPYKPTAANIGQYVLLEFLTPQDLDGDQDYYLILNVTGQSANRTLRLAYSTTHQTSYGRSSILLRKDNSIVNLQQTFAFYLLCSGGYIPLETNILSYSIPGQIGNTQINSATKEVHLSMPIGTDLSALQPRFVLSYGARAEINDQVQQSGVSTVNLNQPVVYKIINGNDTALWQVTVNLIEAGADILQFNIAGQIGSTIINNQLCTIDLTMPYSTNLASLTPTFTLSEGATAYVGSVQQVSGVTTNNFTNPVTYVIESATGQQKEWLVTVTKPENPSTETLFLSFGFTGQTQPSIINVQNHEIRVNMPIEANLTLLVPIFVLSPGAKAIYNGEPITSGTAVIDFSTPKIIRVVAENNVDYSDWTIIVTNNVSEQAAFLSFTVPIVMRLTEETDTTIFYNAQIYPANQRMVLHLPNYVPIDTIIPQWTVSEGARVFVGDEEIISGTTPIKLQPQITFSVKSQSEGGKIIKEWVLYTYRSIVGVDFTDLIDENIKIYPNPAHDFLQVQLPEEMRNGHYSIINMAGQTIAMDSYKGIEFRIVTSHQPGIYFIQIQSHRKRIIRKIVLF